MKLIHTTIYKLYNKNDFKISIINDVHFSRKIGNKLELLLSYFNKIKPDYIFIPGDLIDSINAVLIVEQKNKLIDWLSKLGEIAKVIISLGNHDIYKIENNNIDEFDYKCDIDFFKELKLINNVYLLDNEKYIDDYIYAAGITLSKKYYYREDINILKKELEDNKKILTNLPKDKVKFLLIHSPYRLENEKIKEKIAEFDYFISGHMHNGCVPPIINEIWKSNRGIIAPTSEMFIKNARSKVKNENDKLIINGPVTMFQKSSKTFQLFNFMYPIYTSLMDFNSKNKFKVIKNYHK